MQIPFQLPIQLYLQFPSYIYPKPYKKNRVNFITQQSSYKIQPSTNNMKNQQQFDSLQKNQPQDQDEKKTSSQEHQHSTIKLDYQPIIMERPPRQKSQLNAKYIIALVLLSIFAVILIIAAVVIIKIYLVQQFDSATNFISQKSQELKKVIEVNNLKEEFKQQKNDKATEIEKIKALENRMQKIEKQFEDLKKTVTLSLRRNPQAGISNAPPKQSAPQIPPPPGMIKDSIQYYIYNLQKNLNKQTKTYMNIKQFNGIYKQLPFCLVITQQNSEVLQNILLSIAKQNYTNYQILKYKEQYKLKDSAEYSFSKEDYDNNLKILKQKCPKNAIVMFVKDFLKENALLQTNKVFQEYKAWAIYEKSNSTLEVFAFYIRIYQLLKKSDFSKTNEKYLKNNTKEVIALGLLQIAAYFSKSVKKQSIYVNIGKPSYLSVNLSEEKKILNRSIYTMNQRLSQDFQNPVIFNQEWKRVQPNSVMMKAYERQQLWYLPLNHSVADIQYKEYVDKYKINKYETIDKQVRFCVTILNNNNVVNDRYIKNINSVVEQKYENYHIVFIDDFSNDNNLGRTKQYVEKELNFSKNRITYVQNKQRLYATYNIFNAVYNYCGSDEVQMLIDGDDEVIGRYAFQVLNAAYQNNPNLWVVYSTEKSNLYQYGRSRRFNSQKEHLNNGKRVWSSRIAHIVTWRASLLYNIPIKYQSLKNGSVMDTGYDDALAFCLMELSTISRVLFIDEILYEYNKFHGNNDDSTSQKISHRWNAVMDLAALPPLKALEKLNVTVRDEGFKNLFDKDKGVKYVTIQNR